eukprot:CAMPEP_0114515242 /NCGR_PEP_ID=MMETSP0109-20121206/16620_1 /TAXON_ID=29199 /ORGANISM="Chlorarachnion reptans, Strain CCCM449" /LENGTH=218 /DNA_ID=CAMNT_0001695411 /DNA_START=427 /DNA_END=1083 /DNA_ORIENTATION=-
MGTHMAKAGVRRDHPTKEEVSSLFKPSYQWDEDYPFSPEDMERLDETDDTLFYDEPKLVEHIDEAAVLGLTRFHETRLNSIAKRLGKPSDQLTVLDTCSSWVSHLGDAPPRKVVGLGMNKEELKLNPCLSERVVKDLNKDSSLPFESNSFDVVLCQLSIDYLTQPVAFSKEAFRVLRPGGEFIVTFSNRLFFSKAIAGWTGKSDLDHLETVLVKLEVK